VTLSEVYQFAFNRTLANTAASFVGGQHPTYDYRMAGAGEVILTRTRPKDARLAFAREAGAPYAVFNRSQGDVVAEVPSSLLRSESSSLAGTRHSDDNSQTTIDDKRATSCTYRCKDAAAKSTTSYLKSSASLDSPEDACSHRSMSMLRLFGLQCFRSSVDFGKPLP
jgi:hypothetical protein